MAATANLVTHASAVSTAGGDYDYISIERKTTGEYAEVHVANWADTPWTDTGPFSNGVTYYYRARRTTPAGTSSYSNEDDVAYVSADAADANYVERSPAIYQGAGSAVYAASANYAERTPATYQGTGSAVASATANLAEHAAAAYQATGSIGPMSANADLVPRSATAYNATASGEAGEAMANFVERTAEVLEATRYQNDGVELERKDGEGEWALLGRYEWDSGVNDGGPGFVGGTHYYYRARRFQLDGDGNPAYSDYSNTEDVLFVACDVYINADSTLTNDDWQQSAAANLATSVATVYEAAGSAVMSAAANLVGGVSVVYAPAGSIGPMSAEATGLLTARTPRVGKAYVYYIVHGDFVSHPCLRRSSSLVALSQPCAGPVGSELEMSKPRLGVR